MMSFYFVLYRFLKIHFSGVFFYCFFLILTLIVSGYVVRQNELKKIQEIGAHRLEMSYAGLKGSIDKYAYLPFILTSDQNVQTLLEQPKNIHLKQKVNIYLENVNQWAKARTIYLLDQNGTAIASSNWNTPESFIGNHYVHRPYYQEAMQKQHGYFYGVGETSRIPGYYLSQAVIDSYGKIKGVIVVKITLLQLESIWKQKNEDTFVADENGVIFLSSYSGLRWKTLHPLNKKVLDKIRTTKQYDIASLSPLSISKKEKVFINETAIVTLSRASQEYLQQKLYIPDLNWKIFILSDIAGMRQSVYQVQMITFFAYGFLGIFILYLKQRRKRAQEALQAQYQLKKAYDELEQKVLERTQELVEANSLLQKEIKEREKTEQSLRETQDELIQAAKLAVIGQMATGMTHELNQPLAAMRPLVENMQIFLERQQYTHIGQNIVHIVALITRMSKITSQLRIFSRKTKLEMKAICLQNAIHNVLLLLEQSQQIRHVKIVTHLPEEFLYINADDIRIEQVLLNLCRNALDAMQKNLEWACLEIQLERMQENKICLSIADNGTGIPPDILPHIFEPFFTTKESGYGLGLGLAISQSIMNDYRGEIRIGQRLPQGTIFELHFESIVIRHDEAHHSSR